MIINILTQGLTTDIEKSVGVALVKYLNSTDYRSFTFISAFASEAGIYGLSEHIEKAKGTFAHLNIIVGVDQKGTSKEALEALMSLNIGTYIFYHTGHTIFHPKIYLFEGDSFVQLIVGSSNLTTQGLFTNIEASLHIELNLQYEADKRFLDDLKSRFAGLFDLTEPNLKPISAELIDHFVREKIVPTEAERKEIQEKIEELGQLDGEPVGKIIKTLFPKRLLPSSPKEFKRKRKSRAVGGRTVSARQKKFFEDEADNDTSSDSEFELVWQRRKLPASSVEIGGTANTNPTGGLRLVQDKFVVEGTVIDQTSYFRNTVFGGLPWAVEKTSPLVEKAIGKFHVMVPDENLGLNNLEIRYKPSGEAGQHNYTTSISWGILSKTIRGKGLTGRTLNLYRSLDEPDTFKLEIL